MRFEIVADVFAHPDLVALFDAHVAVGHHLARLLVHRRAVRHEHRVAVFHTNALVPVARDPPSKSTLPVGRAGDDLIERPHFPRRLLLRKRNERKNAPKKISAAMAGKLLIRRGQLNRTKRGCQAGFHRLNKKSQSLEGTLPRPGNYFSGKKANATAARMHTNAATWFHRIFSPRYKIAKPQKTASVMTSWMILSWVAE